MLLFSRKLTGAGFVLLLGSMCLSPARVQGQPQARGGDADPQAGDSIMSMAYPTGDRATSTLLIELQNPGQVPIGKNYDYQIKVTNLSKSLVLDNVKVHQTLAEGFSIEKSEPETHENSNGRANWSIPRLGPGETSTIRVTGLGDKEGDVSSCFRATYEPSLCATTRFIRQEIQLSKSAPESANYCDPIAIHYVVKNTGSGPVKDVRLRDELPKGLATSDGGKSAVDVKIGELAVGQSREITVNAVAQEPGKYTSRAVAEGPNDLQARSNETTTRIVQANLDVQIAGPGAQYMNEAMTYKVTVKNEGNAIARDAKLQVEADPEARVLRVSKSAPNSVEPQASGHTVAWNLGNLEPGQTSEASFTVVARGKATLNHTATATSACARGGDAARSVTTVNTEILTYPALLLEMVDRVDPVKVGDEEVYTIVVLNQGEGEDRDVKVVCNLPEGLSFVKADGPTNAGADGQTVTFDPIDKLDPKEKATWTLHAKVNKPGDVRTKVNLTSDYLTTPVTETEPTRLIGHD
ncbi:CARDB domain-containing protein [Tundrisphaera lichenicola]|uniref:CARDB domain-containing protein n=1 Tax=Tundrisphaera lichenicola TaxID=2029860 RepID=UPI003EBBA820